jgi:zinc transport system permease protein
MVRAIIAGILVAITLPVMGSFLVARRYSLIADSLAHVSLAGIGAGLLFGFAPTLAAIPLTAAGAILLEYLRQNRHISGETSLAILMSGGLAVAVVLANLASGAQTDFESYLFGSITTTSMSDLIVLAIVVVAVLAIIVRNYRTFLHIAFDEDSARVAGHNVSLFNYLLAVMTAVVVVLSLRIIGGLLISALLVLPVMTAAQFARSFSRTIGFAIIFALIAVIAGLVIAFYVGIAAGGAIVLAALTLFILALLFTAK